MPKDELMHSVESKSGAKVLLHRNERREYFFEAVNASGEGFCLSLTPEQMDSLAVRLRRAAGDAWLEEEARKNGK